MEKLHIGIVGAGFAGLASATLLGRAGHRVAVFDRFEQPRSVGAGILIQPTGMQAMQRLGVLRSMLDCGERINRLHGVSGGRTVLDISYSDWRNPPMQPAHGLGLHRGSLFSALWQTAQQAQVQLHVGHPVTDIDSLRQRFDLLILADGAHSVLRGQMGVPCSHRIYPWGAVWAMLPDPQRQWQQHTLFQTYRSARQMMGIMPSGRLRHLDGTLGSTPLVSVFWSLPHASYPQWAQQGLDAVTEQMLELCPVAAPLLAQLTDIGQWQLATYADVVMPAGMYRGNCIAIGDAAHACSPQLGQGTNMALIDAVSLADAIAAAASLPDALADWQQQRQAQLRFYGQASRWLTPLYQSHQRVLPWCRDHIMPFMMRHLPYLRRAQVEVLAGVRQGWLR